MTEEPEAIYRCRNGHLLDYPNQLCNICLEPMAVKIRYDHIKDVPTDLLAHNVVGSLITCEGNLNRYKDIISLLIRELRGEPHPPEIQAALDRKVTDDETDVIRGHVEHEE